ncbi:MAG: AAA family ATPase [Candidatus Nanoarchaeia archaeon]
MSKVIIITGPPSSGKSTISHYLAKHIENCAYINVDSLRHMIQSGYVEPWKNSQKALEQQTLGVKNCCSLTNNFIQSKFNVIIDDVIDSEELYNMYLQNINSQNIHIFLLLPNKDTLIQRDKSREEYAMNNRAEELYDSFERIKNNIDWVVIDNSNLSVEETANQILRKTNKK